MQYFFSHHSLIFVGQMATKGRNSRQSSFSLPLSLTYISFKSASSFKITIAFRVWKIYFQDLYCLLELQKHINLTMLVEAETSKQYNHGIGNLR